jgi:hypothetical protein
VYDLRMDVTWESRGKVRPGSEDADDGVQEMHPAQRGAISRTDGVHSAVERGAISRTDGVHGVAPDPVTTNPTQNPTNDPADGEPSHQDRAETLSKAWWDHYQSTVGPILRSNRSNPFIALRDKVVRPALEAGWTENEVKRALQGPKDRTPDAVPSISVFQKRLAEARNPVQSGNGNRAPAPSTETTARHLTFLAGGSNG